MVDAAAWSNLNVDFHLVGHTGTSYRLRPPHTYLFGRDDFAHFQINDVLTSRRHCELRWEAEQGWLLVDLGSRNGTVLNGVRLDKPQPLKDHDALRVGGQHLTFLILPKGADIAAYIQTTANGNATYEAVPGEVVMPVGGSFSGRLGDAGLLPILEFCLMTGKSGQLTIADDPGRRVWFVNGAPRDAAHEALDGQEALEELLKICGLDFIFQEGVPPPHGDIITMDPGRLLASLARGQSLMDTNDINRAQSLQSRMLERIPSLAGYDIAVRYNAYSGIGGDFYDIGPLPDGQILICIGDVSGHGVQGALVVAMALKTLRLLRTTMANPLELAVRFNDEIRADLLPSQFITLFMAALNPATGQLRVVLAGHHPGYVVKPDGTVSNIGSPGLVIGMMGSDHVRATLSTQAMVLAPGEILFQCTDGLLEARQRGCDDDFSTAQLESSFARLSQSPSALEFLNGIEADLNAFSAGHLDDDLTLLALIRQRP